jgi:hypothetical protein
MDKKERYFISGVDFAKDGSELTLEATYTLNQAGELVDITNIRQLPPQVSPHNPQA